jgi:hypothetical protein
MRTRDADLAESLMRSHILRATTSLQDMLDKEELMTAGTAGTAGTPVTVSLPQRDAR